MLIKADNFTYEGSEDVPADIVFVKKTVNQKNLKKLHENKEIATAVI